MKYIVIDNHLYQGSMGARAPINIYSCRLSEFEVVWQQLAYSMRVVSRVGKTMFSLRKAESTV